MKNILWIGCVLLSFLTMAQNHTLQGKVVDENHAPLPDVIVGVKGYSNVVFTGKNGEFTYADLSPKKHIFVLDYDGNGHAHQHVEVVIKNDTIIEKPWVLSVEIQTYDAVEVTGNKYVDDDIKTLSSEKIDAEGLRKNAGGSLMQSLSKLPGIKSISIGSSTSKPLIRGLGFNQVAVIENGIKHEGQEWGADHGLEIDQYNITAVNIVKGPSSFLYGSDAITGAVILQSENIPPPHSLGGNIEWIGKSNNLSLGGSAQIFGRKDHWFFNVRATYIDYADYRVPTNVIYPYNYEVTLDHHFVRNTAGKNKNIALSFGYLGDIFSNSTTISLVHDKSGFFANAHGLEPFQVNTDLHDASHRDILLPSDKVTHLKIINRSKLKIQNHYLKLDVGFQKNYRKEFGQYVAHGYMPPIYPETAEYAHELERLYDKNVLSINLHDKLSVFRRNILSYGINGELQHNAIGGWGFLIPAFNAQSIGGYIMDKIAIQENMDAVVALRYDHNFVAIQEYKDWFESDVVENGVLQQKQLVRATDFQKNQGNLSWSAGLKYDLRAFQFTLNIGKSFRMPIAKELAANGVNYHYFRYEKGNKNLSPEESYQADLGIEFEQKKVHIKITPYFNYFTNFIYLNPTSNYDTDYGAGNQIFEYTETAVLRTGVELQAHYQMLDELSLNAAGEYLYNEQLSGAKKGFSLPYSPPASALLSLTYEPKIASRLWTKPYLSLASRLTAKQEKIVPPEKKTPGYHLWDISAGTSVKLKNNTIDIRLSVKNIFNTTYFNHTSFYRLIELPEMGRDIILSVKVPFQLKRKHSNDTI